MSESIYSEYFHILKDATQTYGNKTVLLMQVGAFLEIYGVSPSQHISPFKYIIFDVCQICDLNVTEKSKATHEGSQVYMAGFRDFTSEKYIQKLVNASFNVVVYLQEKNEKNTKRIFHAVYSPGTYLPFENDMTIQLTNNIICIWIDTYTPQLRKTLQPTSQTTQKNIVYGVAISNIYTGKSSLFEHQMPFMMSPTTFDELERIMSVYSPSEVIICSDLEENQLNQIVQYAGIKTQSIHFVRCSDHKAQNCTKQTYIQSILSLQFGEDCYQICSEFSLYPIATQAYCFLLNFVKEHNPNLIKNITLPIFENTSVRTILANHTLKQLNIIDDSSTDSAHVGTLSSVSSFLNKCCSPIGKRKFYSIISNPVFDEEWLTTEYQMINIMLEHDNYQMITPFRKLIGGLCDIEKVVRQLVSRRIYPNLIWKLYNSIDYIQQIHTCLYETPTIVDYLCSDFDTCQESKYTYIENILCVIKETIHTNLDIEKCAGYNHLGGFDDIIIMEGVCAPLDSLVLKRHEEQEMMLLIPKYLNDIIRNRENNQTLEYVKIHETEKSGNTLQITKTRAKSLKQYLDEMAKKEQTIVLTTSTSQYAIKIQDIQFKSLNATTDEIKIPLFAQLSSSILELKNKINAVILIEYQRFLHVLETKCLVYLEHIIKYISKLDLLQSKTYVAKEYKYCCPQICNLSSQKSFVNAKELRHCLIEQIQTNEIYVTNDIILGDSCAQDGILLFGTNAVGKTSMIRALGISVILAQSGMFVPCSEFVYKPYHSIFSRILGNDNIFKGLSTFAVEMTELRMILNMANQNSLILGDELCSGTETESALSIFMAGLIDLHDKQSSFIFATHFHEIIHFDEMKMLTNISLKHMTVYYDREKDCLVYDRKLNDGPGNKMYGLEVCKSLHLPFAFLERAYEIRTKYFPETQGVLTQNQTKYNSKKIKGMCEMCGMKKGAEVHHIHEQHLADENGFIGHFHKNHPANLMVLCEECHLKTHHGQTPKLLATENDNITGIKMVEANKTKRNYKKKTIVLAK
jgi:DNA mismatch repair protein MutS